MGNHKPQKMQAESQATPLAQDILNLLRQNLSSGNFGKPMGAQSQEAAGGLSSFIGARQTPDQFMELMGPLRKMFETGTDKAAAGMRESLGGMGHRFSTVTPRLEGEMRAERGTQLDALTSDMFFQEQGKLLEALGLQADMGQAATQPYFDFGALGIMPESLFMGPSKGQEMLGMGGDMAQIFALLRMLSR